MDAAWLPDHGLACPAAAAAAAAAVAVVEARLAALQHMGWEPATNLLLTLGFQP